MGAQQLCIISHNSRGFGVQKQELCKFIVNSTGNKLVILCNQENFLLRANGYIIDQTLPDFQIFFKPAVKDYVGGRAKNGMFVAIPNALKDSVRDVSPNHWRLQAVTVSCENSTFLIISSYFPNDPKTEFFNEGPLQEVLTCIKSLIEKVNFDHFCLTGDINTNWLRQNSGHVRCVKNFISELNLVKAWDIFPIDFTHCYECDDVTHISIIDHFFWDQGLTKYVEDCGVLHLPENSSDHEPIYCVLSIPKTDLVNEVPCISHPKPNWKRANFTDKTNFKQMSDNLLSNIQVPDCIIQCTNVHCKDNDHCNKIDDYLFNILDSLESSAKQCLQMSGVKCNMR